MKVTGDWIENPHTQIVMQCLKDAGNKAYFVGGCVRNALLGAAVNDIDISTDATPDQVIKLATEAGLNSIPTGIDHGTVTVMSDGIPHEITTFRKDVETDGRRAVVAFSTDIHDDALRRDFTINALYADAGGQVVDPLNGLHDLITKHVRFIEDADQRIKEDSLRILRYFRFHAWYGDPDQGMDADALAAIAENVDQMHHLSKERIGAEVLKLLNAPNPALAVATMQSCGVLNACITGADARALPVLIGIEDMAKLPSDPIRRLAALGGQDIDIALRLSRAQATKLKDLRNQSSGTMGPSELAYRYGASRAYSVLALRAAFLEMPWDGAWADQIKQGAKAEFPIKACDIMDRYQGAALGERLRYLEREWIASGFELTRAQLLVW